ncbi:MAG: hypothetical protein Q4C67_08180 [Deinococcus sp.]|nr:hypothetical protein [Deinococcus sp.]
MRFTVLSVRLPALIWLLALTWGLPGTSVHSAQATAQQTAVVTVSGPAFPWGLLGVLGLIGLARRHPPRRVVAPAPQDAATWPAAEQAPETWSEDAWAEDTLDRDEGSPRPLNPHPQSWPDAEQDAWDEESGDEEPGHAAPVPATPQSERPGQQPLSERLSRRQPGAPDLSKPPRR